MIIHNTFALQQFLGTGAAVHTLTQYSAAVNLLLPPVINGGHQSLLSYMPL